MFAPNPRVAMRGNRKKSFQDFRDFAVINTMQLQLTGADRGADNSERRQFKVVRAEKQKKLLHHDISDIR